MLSARSRIRNLLIAQSDRYVNSLHNFKEMSVRQVLRMRIIINLEDIKEQGWHSWLVRGLGTREPEFDPRISHPCFDFFPFSVA